MSYGTLRRHIRSILIEGLEDNVTLSDGSLAKKHSPSYNLDIKNILAGLTSLQNRPDVACKEIAAAISVVQDLLKPDVEQDEYSMHVDNTPGEVGLGNGKAVLRTDRTQGY